MAGAMDGPIMALLIIGIGVTLGVLLFRVGGEYAAGANSVFGLLSRVFWVVLGIVLVFGGFVFSGLMFIAIGLFLALGHWQILKDSDLRAAIAGD